MEVKKLIEEMNLPEQTKFIGYAIHLQKEDEFLLNYEDKKYIVNMWWTKSPEIAKKFKSIKKAEKTKNKIKPEANIVLLLDTGTQIYAALPKD